MQNIISPRDSLKKELTLLTKSECPYLFLVSYEDDRIIETVSEIGKELNKEVFIWSSITGLYNPGKPLPILKQSQSLRQTLEDIERYSGPALFIVLDAPTHLESTEVTRLIRNISESISKKSKTIFFVGTQEKIPSDISRLIPAFYFPLPDASEFKNLIHELNGKFNSEEELSIANACIGLTLYEGKRIFKRAVLEGDVWDKEDLQYLIAEKAKLVKKSSALTFMPSFASLNSIGGLDYLKKWVIGRGKAMSPDAKKFGLPSPKGVLLLGVQGCGKSLSCKMIANEWGVPLLKLDMGAIYGSYIGMSEENIRTALATAEAIAPCVLWIDEIEKGLAGLTSSDGSDGGTTSRVFSTILSWLQEKSSAVFVAATANRIESLPPELLRKGRFDEIFFVDLPNTKERKEIFAIHLNNHGRKPENFNINAHAEATANYSGAEIEQIIINALFDAYAVQQELSDNIINKSISDTVPLSKTMAEDIQKLQRWAYDRARPASKGE